MPRPARILIVDDDADWRGLLSTLLQSEGRRVIEAADGQLALDELASSRDVDVIILDLMMPVMDGATFLAHKARGAQATIPVVIFSSSPAVGLEGLAGVVSVLPKVAGIDGVLAAVRCAEGVTPLYGSSRAIQS